MSLSLVPDIPPALSVHKGYLGETHRSIDPKETRERLERLLPIMAITRVANVTGLDHVGIPVVMVCRPGSRSLAVSQGKGATLTAAWCSGVMEAVESFSAERITLPLKLASYNELRFTHQMVDLARLPRSSAAPFQPERQMLWIEARELTSSSRAWLPFEIVHSNYTLPLPPTSGAFLMSSSGLAAGNHLLEAKIHALCELIERDAFTLWSCSSRDYRSSRRLDLDTVTAPICRQLLDRYAAAGISVAVWDLTHDIGIPTFHCAIAPSDPDPFHPVGIAGGSGCHLDRQVSLTRALTEAAQSRLTQISGSRDDIALTCPEPKEFLAAVERFHSRLEEPGPRRSFVVESFDNEDLDADLDLLLGRLRAVGLDQVWAVDLTTAGLAIPVVRLIVPGLEASCEVPGYLPGRRARAILRSRR